MANEGKWAWLRSQTSVHLATGVHATIRKSPCLGLVDLFGGRLETWESEGTLYRYSLDSAQSHLNTRVHSCWASSCASRPTRSAGGVLFHFQKTGFLTLATTARLLTESLNQANGGFETPSPFAGFPFLGKFAKVADEKPSRESVRTLALKNEVNILADG